MAELSKKRRVNRGDDDDHNVIIIPGDILGEILIRLPLKSLLQFRNVCKDWQSMIDDPVFAKLHHDRQQGGRHMIGFHDEDSLLHTVSMRSLACATTNCTRTIQARKIDNDSNRFPVDLANPCRCHGFFLTQWKERDQLIWVKHNCSLWNPFTAQLLELPWIPVDTDRYFVFAGLGYVSATYEYKVVLIFSRGDGSECTTYIYSLKSGVWRRLQGLPHRCSSLEDGVFVNGALHWGRSYGQREKEVDYILAFDLSTETFSELPMPPCKGYYRTMDALGGYLMVISRTSTPDMRRTNRSMCNFWILEDYDNNKYWRKLITLDCKMVSPPAAVDYIKSKEQVVIRTSYHKFSWYDISKDDDVKLVKTVTLNSYQQQEEDKVFRDISVWWTNIRDYGTTDDDSEQSTVNQRYQLNKFDVKTVISPTS